MTNTTSPDLRLRGSDSKRLSRAWSKENNPKTLVLRVAEAQSKDVGRAIARVDPKDLLKIHAEIGDILQIKNSRSMDSTRSPQESSEQEKTRTVVRAMPQFAEKRGKNLIQIDGITRENAHVGLDERVEVQKMSCSEARTIILSPLSSEGIFHEEDSRYLAQMLDGTPVVKGDKMRITLFGSRAQDFFIAETDPDGAVLIKPTTTLKIKGTQVKKQKAGITYEDIGGLSREVQKIREMIELPLKYPEVFERLGIDPPKGVLLHGPPGCGKTLIARAVANETDAYFTHISGPEIMGKYYGESEGRLREVFEEAADNAPAILFIDEIDAIAPKREDLDGEKQVERRVVAQLLALMDGLESRGQIIVIGATNIPNVLDLALRRPGRFDREIVISIPDRKDREEILEIHTRGMPLAENVSLRKLAEITHGFVGADLEALSREAAMAVLREIIPEIEFEKEYIPYSKLQGIEVTPEHFQEAFREVEPSALREVFTEIPNVTWNQVGGLEHVKQALKETIEWPLQHKEAFDHLRVTPAKGILLYGPPGCGKTLIAKAVATESGVNFISVKGPQLLSKYIGESEKGIREVFKKAKQAAPCIIFFDEIESLAPTRDGRHESGVTERIVSQLLAEMDGVEELKGVVVIAATNRLDMVDPALLRAGRFDFLLEIPKPDTSSRHAVFQIHTQNKPLTDDVNFDRLVQLTEGLTGADIESLCKKASIAAIRENIEKKGDHRAMKITFKHFQEALNQIQ